MILLDCKCQLGTKLKSKSIWAPRGYFEMTLERDLTSLRNDVEDYSLKETSFLSGTIIINVVYHSSVYVLIQKVLLFPFLTLYSVNNHHQINIYIYIYVCV